MDDVVKFIMLKYNSYLTTQDNSLLSFTSVALVTLVPSWVFLSELNENELRSTMINKRLNAWSLIDTS